MGNFTSTFEGKYKFDGDNVTVTLSRLKRVHTISIMPTIDGIRKLLEGKTKEEAKELSGSEEMIKLNRDLADKLTPLLPEYIKSMNGIFDADGALIPVETIVSESYFDTLTSQICADLITNSQLREEPKKDEVGKLDAPSENITEDSEIQITSTLPELT